MNTSESFDPNEEVTVVSPNFQIQIRPSIDGSSVVANVETWKPGTYRAEDHMKSPDSRRRVVVSYPSDTPQAVFLLIRDVAVLSAVAHADNEGVAWRIPFGIRVRYLARRLKIWWREVNARDASEA